MNIKEAEKLSGVSSRNIRFYEQKGLVKPARNTENDYREYSDEEIYRLKLIRALRMVDMPLEQIREVVTGSLPLTQAVADHRAQLLQRREQLETAISFCDSFAEQMDIDALLQQMDDADCKQMLFHRWCRDYLENLRRNTTLVFFGLFPVGTGFMLHMFAVMLWYYVPAAAYILSGVYLLCWGYVGYWLAKRWGTPPEKCTSYPRCDACSGVCDSGVGILPRVCALGAV